MGTELLVSFEEVTLDEAGSDVDEFKSFLEVVAPGVVAEQRRSDDRAMDMGATLAIVLAGPAVVAVAKGIADWIKTRGKRPRLVIRNAAGEEILELDEMPADDLRALLEGKLGDAVGR